MPSTNFVGCVTTLGAQQCIGLHGVRQVGRRVRFTLRTIEFSDRRHAMRKRLVHPEILRGCRVSARVAESR